MEQQKQNKNKWQQNIEKQMTTAEAKATQKGHRIKRKGKALQKVIIRSSKQQKLSNKYMLHNIYTTV